MEDLDLPWDRTDNARILRKKQACKSEKPDQEPFLALYPALMIRLFLQSHSKQYCVFPKVLWAPVLLGRVPAQEGIGRCIDNIPDI
jgi:hypothetical protein